MKVIHQQNWQEYAGPNVEPSHWTFVIPAAGRGTRLGFDQPKILYPVAGRPILEWLLKLVSPQCAEVVLVLSPTGCDPVERELARIAPEYGGLNRYRIVIQPTPAGMGDAVEIGAAVVRTPHTAVLWGDQAGLLPASVKTLLRLHDGPLQPGLTVPTVLRADPYIHFERDAEGRIRRLLQAREGDSMPSTGESDAGFFCFRTQQLRSLLAGLRDSAEARGSSTAEFNLLPIVPYADRLGLNVLTPRIMTLQETIGINSTTDALQIEEHLRSLYA
jgi:bifunctional UDP-N-acetylglucosamine pyrophosphorylase/glucosamine-1-phosphate N-acetyltransferase